MRKIRGMEHLTANDRKFILDGFQRLFYERQCVQWMGYDCQKNVLDLWIYQEIIYEQKPDLIVEMGTWKGGSAYYFASICDFVGHGLVVSVDIHAWHGFPQHQRIMYLNGDSVSPEIIKQVHDLACGMRKIMVILDSDHSEKHVLKELRSYWDIVTPGMYLIIEDTHLNGCPIKWSGGPGPHEAVMKFLKENKHFMIDKNCERLLCTTAVDGFLRRVQ